jgi:hypothetical protein
VLSTDFNGFLGSKILRRDISRMVLDTGGDYRVSQKVEFICCCFFIISEAFKTWTLVSWNPSRKRLGDGETTF